MDKLEVIAIESAATGVVRVDLRAPDGTRLPDWTPGAHIAVELDGRSRQYSLCGSRLDCDQWSIAVLREPESRGGSAYIHEHLTVGELIAYKGPENRFEFTGAAPHTVFIAGGIGITPLIPMMEHAWELGLSWSLYYGGRTLGSMAFTAELSDRYPGRVVTRPQDAEGLLDIDAIIGGLDDSTEIYCCGPTGLIDTVEQTGAANGIQVRTERFHAVPADDKADNGSYLVELAESGREITVAENSSLLDALREHGIDISSSCEEGTCGTCEVQVLAGAITHRDCVLSEDERRSGETMMACVSRCAGPVLRLAL
ncbi:PDR/VanB family oxidoreductase [Nocardia sp. NPDC058518]|uniref:PDR/VanB family oxidoreductase n=1 Tax=Nocardia sp. NPDC058518 TaxID=3346534 RepID=UPI00364A8BC3